MGLGVASPEAGARDVAELQSLNILNVDVLNALSTEILGRPLDLRTLDMGMVGMVGVTTGPVQYGQKIEISTAGTNIPHYTNVRLSHLRKLFEILGFTNLVNFDDGCRIDNPVVASFRSEEEAEARDFEEGKLTPRWKSGEGGKRTRRKFRKQTKRKRSRRFHKKS
jgi:hypothetical protein